MNEPVVCRALAQRLEIICKEFGVGRVSLVTGVTRETLRRYRRSRTVPSAEFLERLCTELDLSAEWLLCGRGPRSRFDVGMSGTQMAALERLAEALRAVMAASDEAGRGEAGAKGAGAEKGLGNGRGGGRK